MAIKKIRIGEPEPFVPSAFCKGFSYQEGEISFDLSSIETRITRQGTIVEFPIGQDEQVFGFGLQFYEINQKGKKIIIRSNADPIKNTGDSHAPVPFFVTNRNRGFYFDTARYAEFYCGYPKTSQRTGEGDSADSTQELYATRASVDSSVMSVLIPSAPGVDLFIIEGKNVTDVVSQYNMMSGGGCKMPDWGLGTLFRTHHDITEKDVLDLAHRFREKGFPINIIGLEPGWQTKHYPCSYIKNPGNFPHFDEMVAELVGMGYHINLWEQCFVHETAPFYEEIKPYSGSFPVWGGLVPDFSVPQARKIFADYQRKHFVDVGVDGFKTDECDGSDYSGGWSFPATAEFPSGADGEQMHNMLGELYCQTMLQALEGHETVSEVRNMGALAAPYPFVLYSDLYNHSSFITALVNSGFSGLLWSPEVRSTTSKKDLLRRLETVIFSPHCLINAWNCTEICPWYLWDCEDEARDLLKTRDSLQPMLRKAFDKYHDEGVPVIRALVMDWTDDPETWNIKDEYMFCENLLVAPLTAESDTRRVYLPAGKWKNYFTGEPVESGWHDVTMPAEIIPVYEKL